MTMMKTLLKYRKILWILILLLVSVGIFTYIQLPKRDIPEINQPLASIQVIYPGAAPESMEKAITTPLEEELLTIDGIDEIQSASLNGFVNLTLVLSGDTDTNQLYQNINQRVSAVRTSFPDDVRAVNISTDLIQSNVETFHIAADDYETLLDNREAIHQFADSLTEISGVKSTDIRGLPSETLSVQIEPDLLARYQLQPNQVIETISRTIQPTPLGTDQPEDTIRTLTLTSYQNLDDFKATIIAQANGENVTLEDVASIDVVTDTPSSLIHEDGQAVVSVTVQADDGINILNLETPLTDAQEQADALFSDEVTISSYFSQTTIIDDVYSSLLESLIISLIAVLVIMVLGLPITSAILVALAIPLSIIIGLIPLPYTGVDLNQISVIGMIVAIGILVDDAIVVNDNIERRFLLGDSAREGVINGVKEVRVSIITSTLLIVFSFIPLTFLSGSNGDFIRGLPLALVFTVLASTFLALSFMPAFRYQEQKLRKQKKQRRSGLLNPVFEKLSNIYADKIVPFSLKRPVITIVSGLVIMIGFLSLILLVPIEFFPAAEREEVTITATLPAGTPLEETQETLIAMEDFFKETDVVKETASYAGEGLPGIFGASIPNSGTNTGHVVVRIDQDKTKVLDFIDTYEKDARQAFPNVTMQLDTIVSGPPASADVSLTLKGEDLSELLRISEDLNSQLQASDAVSFVSSNSQTKPFTEVAIDEEAMLNYGFSETQVTGLMQLASIGAPLGTFDDGNMRLPINLSYNDNDPTGLALDNLELASFSGESPMPTIVSLDEFVAKNNIEQVNAINHLNGDRFISFDIFTTEDGDVSSIIDAVRSELPDGFSLAESGEQDTQTEFFLEVGKLFLVVLFLIYTTLAIQFNSLTTPILISFTILLALSGAIVGLFISGEPLSFLGVLGIVALSGVIVRNAILLIEFIEQNRDNYKSLTDAFIEAGRLRLKPILLTTLTSMAALIPIIITGDVLFKPLAVAIVYGIFFATLLTLVLIPPLYLALLKLRKEA